MQDSSTTTNSSLIEPSDGAIRGTLAIGLLMISLVHVIDGIGKWTDGPRYEFWMFMALVVSSAALAGAHLFSRHKLLMPATIGLVGSALVAFILSRTTGLPSSTDDIGNWTETIGVVNVFVEVVTLAVAIPAMALAHRTSPRALRAPAASLAEAS